MIQKIFLKGLQAFLTSWALDSLEVGMLNLHLYLEMAKNLKGSARGLTCKKLEEKKKKM